MKVTSTSEGSYLIRCRRGAGELRLMPRLAGFIIQVHPTIMVLRGCMLLQIQRAIKQELAMVIKRVFEIELAAAEIAVEYPPKPELGDLAIPIAFALASRLKAATGTKQNPRQLGERLRGELPAIAG